MKFYGGFWHRCPALEGNSMFYKWRKYKNLKRIINSLPGELATRYGASDYYTPEQVSKTMETKKYSKEFAKYAQVIFIAPEKCVPELMPTESYEIIRTEIANKYFDGDTDFVAKSATWRNVGNTGHSTYGVIQESLGARNR